MRCRINIAVLRTSKLVLPFPLVSYTVNAPLFFLLLHLYDMHQKSMDTSYTCYCLMDLSILLAGSSPSSAWPSFSPFYT